MSLPSLDHQTITAADGVRLHVVTAGPRDGKPVILLHGFPDFWEGWVNQIGPLAAAGLRVIVPDQRGYNKSDKPNGVSAYRLDKLVGDVEALANALGVARFALVGHDWGGVAAWAAAARLRDRVERLVVMNTAHPDVFVSYLRTSPSQMLKSSYVAFFQLPFLPERVLGANDHAALVRVLKRSSRPGAFSREDIEAYRAAWSKPGALTAMLDWYRALPRGRRSGAAISAPTLILWGEKDEFLEVGLARHSMSFCSDARLQTFPEATHWLQREEIEGVNAALLAFLA